MPGRSGTSAFCRGVILEGEWIMSTGQGGKGKTGIVTKLVVLEQAALVSKPFPGRILHCTAAAEEGYVQTGVTKARSLLYGAF
jgi:hypothetical protein